MNIGIVGLGLIGGSIARDLTKNHHTVYGYDMSNSHIEQALQLKLISRSLPLEELCKSCDAIFVSIPVNFIADACQRILDVIPLSSIVIDTGSTKASICEKLRNHPKRGRFVACHPLAGTEFSGPKAAINDLFSHKKNIVCEEHLSDEDALDRAVELFEELNMQSLFMDPEKHDMHMAYVSHLSHVSSFMLGSTVLDIEKDEKHIVNLASTGFQSTVRLAKSSPETWSAIFSDNSENIIEALEAYIQHLSKIVDALKESDEKSIFEMLKKSNEIKRVLSGMKYNIVKLS